jgi:hypothetical protein
MDPTGEAGPSGFVINNISNQDKRALDLIGWNVVGAGAPGDWRSIRLERFSGDRNVEVTVEREEPGVTAPGTNATPATAEFVGRLAPHEKGGDDNRRLGFEIHGFLSSPSDLDVYSFDAQAGTEVWFDVDRSTHALDAVVELVDTRGTVIARSDNSAAEEKGVKLLDPSGAQIPFGTAVVISKSAFLGQDRWTTNPRDPGMRLLLPGRPGTTNTYHVRVRSSNPNVATDVNGGLTSGVYQLGIRLGEPDEIPGSTVRFADIRYATSGIEVLGQPVHSPLLGEVREAAVPNDLITDAQNIGNVLATERGTLSIAGELVDLDPVAPLIQPDVDWYRLELNWQSAGALFPLADLIFDLDYADGLARPNASIFVFQPNGTLVISSVDSNITDDQPAPLGGSSITDLSRGSAGRRDPLIGPVDLPTGTYLVAVTTGSLPDDYNQFRTATPDNPLVRLEPVDSVVRIAEDHIGFNGGSTAAAPVTPRLTDGLYRLFVPGGSGIQEGETVTVVNFLGASATYEFDSDGVLFGPNVAVPYTLTDPDFLVAATLAGSIASSPPSGVAAFAGGNQVVLQDFSAPDLNVRLVGTSPESEIYLSRPTVVPFDLSDVTLYVSQEGGLVGTDMGSLVTVDPFSGLLETTIGSFAPDIGDLAMRVEIAPLTQLQPLVLRGELFSFTLGGLFPDDDTTGNYLQIDSTNAAITIIGDDGIETYDPDPMFVPPDPPDPMNPVFPSPVRAGMGLMPNGVGVPFNAITFLDPLFAPAHEQFGLAVGARTTAALMGEVASDALNKNILYLFNRTSGMATSSMEMDRPVTDMLFDPMFQTMMDPSMTFPTPATQIRERGVLDTSARGGPGGLITGMTTLNGQIFAVSNTGGFFRINASAPTFFGATLTYITTIMDDGGDPIPFAGLTAGPPNVEQGRYAETLFAIDEDAKLYALSTRGVLQPIFVDGAISVQTGAANPTGLAFSTLDQNLWHVTDQRMNDAGHGLEIPVTLSRNRTENGDLSLHFGITTPDATRRNFNFPGGAHGSLISNPFSLADYELGAQPVVYFNYFLDTEGTDYNPRTIPPTPMRDSFRVFISDDSRLDRRGKWYLLATNNSFRDRLVFDEYDDPDPFDDVVIEVQELFDNTNGWRQARIDLSPFAGSDKLRLRFDFSSAGEMNVGAGKTQGEQLRMVDAFQLLDGQTFTIDGNVFEFDFGYTVVTPSGKNVPDGETLTIEGGNGAIVTFELDRDGAVQAGHVPIMVTDTMTAGNLALALQQAIATGPLGQVPAPTAMLSGDLTAEGNDILSQALTSGLTPANPGRFQGFGNIAAHGNVTDASLDVDMLQVQLAVGGRITARADSPAFDPSLVLFDSAGNVMASTRGARGRSTLSFDAKVGGSYFLGVSSAANIAYDPTTEGSGTATGAAGNYTLQVDTRSSRAVPIRHENRLNVQLVTSMSQQSAAGQPRTSVFIDGTPGAQVGFPVSIDIGMNDLEVTDAVVTAMADAMAGGSRPAIKVNKNTINVIAHSVVDPGQLGVARQLIGDTGPQNLGAFNISGPPAITMYPGALRAFDNIHEGVYLDDLVIGFAERGELLTGNVGRPDTDFITVRTESGADPTDIRLGTYQLEIRRGPEYSIPVAPADPLSTQRQQQQLVSSSFDTNARLTQNSSLDAPAGADISPGQTFVLGGGNVDITFEYVDRSVAEGNDTIPTALRSGLAAGARGTYRGIGVVGDNTIPTGDNNNPPQGLDVDLIAVPLARGDVLTVDIDAANPDVAGTFASTLDSILRIFDSTGRMLAINDNRPAPGDLLQSPFFDSYIELTATAAGTYFVGVSGNGNATYDPLVEGSGMLGMSPFPTAGPYQIEVRVNGGQPDALTGNVPIGFGDFETSAAIADRIIATINSARVQSRGLNVTAKRFGIGNRIELFGPNVNVDRVKNALTPEANDRLLDAIDSGILPGQDRTYRAEGQIGDNRLLVTDPALDVDLFEMQLHVGEILRVDTTTAAIHSTLTPGLRLLDASGAELLRAVPALTPEASFVFRIPATGSYFVGMSSAENLDYNPRAQGSGASGSMGDYQLQIQVGRGQVGLAGENIGDSNTVRDQGQILIQSNVIRDTLRFGIVVDAAPRDTTGSLPHAGPVRNLQELNPSNLAPGVTVANNIIARSGSGGIHFSGDPNPAATPVASVPFGRILNNTIFGLGGEMFPDIRTLRDRFNVPIELEPRVDDIGILVTDNASPTLLNNLVVNLDTGVSVDGTSPSTVIGGTVYQGNDTNATTALGVGLGDFPILLRIADTLFVDAAGGNFYLDEGSRAIDSSVDSLEDRSSLVNITGGLGISLSPILTPNRDVSGQLRVDDPNVDTPAGLGENVFKDRGALDRADFIGPTAELVTPRDNDASGTDNDPTQTVVQTFATLTEFSLVLRDGAIVSSSSSVDGIGADDLTVRAESVTVTENGQLLEHGVDYAFSYDRTNDIIRLTPLSGIWQPERTYVIALDNSAESGIRDLANNLLNPNQLSGETRFTVNIGRGVDYGDAPDPTYPTRATSNGASHVIVENMFLGARVDAELDGQGSADAGGDGDEEDGVGFDTSLVQNASVAINVSASAEGSLDAWIDYNRDGDWNDAGEQILFRRPLDPGDNVIVIEVPASATPGATFARFRFSSDGGLAPTGPAPDGEVEDYQVTIYSNPWQNPNDPLDVNARDGVSPIDALLVINDLNNPVYRDPQTGRLPIPATVMGAPPPYLDVNGDGFAAPLDALLVINRLSNLSGGPFAALAPGPDGRAPFHAPLSASAQALTGDAPTASELVQQASSADDLARTVLVVSADYTSAAGSAPILVADSAFAVSPAEDIVPLALPGEPAMGPMPSSSWSPISAAVDDALVDMADEVGRDQGGDAVDDIFAKHLW